MGVDGEGGQWLERPQFSRVLSICADLVGSCSVLDSKLCMTYHTGASVVS